jgi:hypothetical protein
MWLVVSEIVKSTWNTSEESVPPALVATPPPQELQVSLCPLGQEEALRVALQQGSKEAGKADSIMRSVFHVLWQFFRCPLQTSFGPNGNHKQSVVNLGSAKPMTRGMKDRTLDLGKESLKSSLSPGIDSALWGRKRVFQGGRWVQREG